MGTFQNYLQGLENAFPAWLRECVMPTMLGL